MYQVDAFTTNVFGGNPAAVVPLDYWPEDLILQNIAAENNLSETAFFVNAGNAFEIRWFTPKMEVDLCGHATLATAHVLFEHLGFKNDFIHFNTVHHGLLKVFRSGDRITLEFPSTPPVKTACPDALTRGLGIIPPEVHESRDLMAVFETEEQIIRIKPVFDQLKLLPHLGVIITAPGLKTDFVSRFFAPNAGIDEDPVTGSAHTTLIPYWSERLKKKNMVARQLSTRGGDLFCEERNDKVLIAGYARTFFKGEITW